jgi:hypothetical protein
MAWGTDRPFGPLKASLTEPNRQKMQQGIECIIIHWNLHTKGVSKPSIFQSYVAINKRNRYNYAYSQCGLD